jgi:acetylornithine deacetylase
MMTHTAAAIRMIERLVGFPTVSADSNLQLIEFVRGELAAHGIDSRLTYNDEGSKANLFATIGPACAGGIVLSGHTDVVPVRGQSWSADPFCVRRRGERLYGRGTADMKSFLAVALAMVPLFKSSDLRRPIHLAFSFDEELGCLGAPRMLLDILQNTPKPAMAIIGEPTLMQLANRHKGALAFRTQLTGRDAHASLTHRGLSAISCAGELLRFLEQMAEEHRAGPFDASFDPPYTTFNVGLIRGGAAINIISRSCEMLWEFRPIPGVAPETLLGRIEDFLQHDLLLRMRKIAPEAAIVTTPLYHVPALKPDTASAAERLISDLAHTEAAIGVAFGSEAGQFQAAGIPAVVFGPGSIEQAHQPDEYIELQQVIECVNFMKKLAESAAKSDK